MKPINILVLGCFRTYLFALYIFPSLTFLNYLHEKMHIYCFFLQTFGQLKKWIECFVCLIYITTNTKLIMISLYWLIKSGGPSDSQMSAMLACVPPGALSNQQRHCSSTCNILLYLPSLKLQSNGSCADAAVTTMALAQDSRNQEGNERKNEQKDQLCKSQME